MKYDLIKLQLLLDMIKAINHSMLLIFYCNKSYLCFSNTEYLNINLNMYVRWV